jgi:glycosyltransferase involved in cell wall biosynthesis
LSAQVSVVIPSWNRERELVRAVRSALGQTHAVIEVLVCDDGSTDGSQATIEALDEPRVRWLGGERMGRPAGPRNRGIREARGEWVAFLDSDDEWLPQKLERQLEAASRSGARAVCSNALRVGPGVREGALVVDYNGERLGFSELLEVNRVVSSSTLIARPLLERSGGFPESASLIVGEDHALWLRIAAMTPFTFVREPLLRYRDAPAESIRAQGPSEWVERRAVLRDFLAWPSAPLTQRLQARAALWKTGLRQFKSELAR